jgi:hypothetical protein
MSIKTQRCLDPASGAVTCAEPAPRGLIGRLWQHCAARWERCAGGVPGGIGLVKSPVVGFSASTSQVIAQPHSLVDSRSPIATVSA